MRSLVKGKMVDLVHHQRIFADLLRKTIAQFIVYFEERSDYLSRIFILIRVLYFNRVFTDYSHVIIQEFQRQLGTFLYIGNRKFPAYCVSPLEFSFLATDSRQSCLDGGGASKLNSGFVSCSSAIGDLHSRFRDDATQELPSPSDKIAHPLGRYAVNDVMIMPEPRLKIFHVKVFVHKLLDIA